MLKTYRIIPLVFILFLFGFTLITVSPVFAQGQWDPSMGMRHPDRPCMDRARVPGGCGPDTRSPEQIASDPYDTGFHNPKLDLPKRAGPPPPPGGLGVDCEESCQLKARIADLEAENARLLAQQGAPADQSGGEVAQLNAKIAELEPQVSALTTTNAQLQEQMTAESAAIAPLNARIAELEARLGEVAELNAKISGLEARLANKPSDYDLEMTELYIEKQKTKIAELEAQLLLGLQYAASNQGRKC
jgi:hypothetical protein